MMRADKLGKLRTDRGFNQPEERRQVMRPSYNYWAMRPKVILRGDIPSNDETPLHLCDSREICLDKTKPRRQIVFKQSGYTQANKYQSEKKV